ncbi:MAG: YqiJ family protein, partial [Candidatus Accumulibacter sp.]|nr:YqiJ family protein [Accumulibacter sp.]
FGIAGFVIQALARYLSGNLFPALIAGCGSFLAAIPVLRWGGFLLLKILPRDESQAVSLDSLVGRAGIVVLGTARVGTAAQARVRDEYGRFHYIMVEPDDEKMSFEVNAEILLIKRVGGMKFQAIKNPHAGLIGV